MTEGQIAAMVAGTLALIVGFLLGVWFCRSLNEAEENFFWQHTNSYQRCVAEGAEPVRCLQYYLLPREEK